MLDGSKIEVVLAKPVDRDTYQYIKSAKAATQVDPPLLLRILTVFTARRSYASAVLGVVIMSVRLSVCHTRAL